MISGFSTNILENLLTLENYNPNSIMLEKLDVYLKMIKINKEFARQHYIDLKDKPFYGELVDFISRSPLVALILEGEDAVNKVRGINGATDPKDAKEGTIRHKYAKDKTENTVHGSDSVENAKREISMWFPEFLDSYLDN